MISRRLFVLHFLSDNIKEMTGLGCNLYSKCRVSWMLKHGNMVPPSSELFHNIFCRELKDLRDYFQECHRKNHYKDGTLPHIAVKMEDGKMTLALAEKPKRAITRRAQ